MSRYWLELHFSGDPNWIRHTDPAKSFRTRREAEEMAELIQGHLLDGKPLDDYKIIEEVVH